jgi:hypothetical protein
MQHVMHVLPNNFFPREPAQLQHCLVAEDYGPFPVYPANALGDRIQNEACLRDKFVSHRHFRVAQAHP